MWPYSLWLAQFQYVADAFPLTLYLFLKDLFTTGFGWNRSSHGSALKKEKKDTKMIFRIHIYGHSYWWQSFLLVFMLGGMGGGVWHFAIWILALNHYCCNMVGGRESLGHLSNPFLSKGWLLTLLYISCNQPNESTCGEPLSNCQSNTHSSVSVLIASLNIFGPDFCKGKIPPTPLQKKKEIKYFRKWKACLLTSDHTSTKDFCLW